MDDKPRCACCGAVLRVTAASDRARRHAARIEGSREALLARLDRPLSIGGRRDASSEPATAAPSPSWWLPSLAFLAYTSPDTDPDAIAALDEFADRRDALSYAVVEEITDTIIGLTVQPWPLLDQDGRLRFPIRSDPLQLDVPSDRFVELLTAERGRWHELGLMAAELVTRHVQIGDTFAAVVVPATSDSPPAAVGAPNVRAHNDDAHSFFLGGLPPRRSGGRGIPVVDITWDAREAGKLAHYAASAGVIPDEPPPPVAAVVAETETRYLIGYIEGVDPRDVGVDAYTAPAAGQAPDDPVVDP
jgi:hypothetical protein